MKVLMIGGTGIISSAVTQLALQRGIDLTLLNRNRRGHAPSGARTLVADQYDQQSMRAALGEQHWDAVVNWIAFTPEDIERDLAYFSGRTHQYVFISSASCYQKPPSHWLIREDTPLHNPHWPYSQLKIACEDRLQRAMRDSRFPVTIVRPSYTYNETLLPLVYNSRSHPFTLIHRLRRGAPIIVPGDGTSLWTMTHSSDFAKGFVPLLGNTHAIGHTFHITSDEVLTWDQIYQLTARAAGAPEPQLVHIASDYLAACSPDWAGSLLGDKMHSAVFDNSKIKSFAPEFRCTTPFAQGIARSIAWLDADPARQSVDHLTEQRWDTLIASYRQGMLLTQEKLAALPVG